MLSHGGRIILNLRNYRSRRFFYYVTYKLEKIIRVWLTFQKYHALFNLSYGIVTFCKAFSSILFYAVMQ